MAELDDKKLKQLIDEVKAVGDAGGDMATSDELKNLEDAFNKETETLKQNTEQLKRDAKDNRKMNAGQILYEALMRKSTKKAQENVAGSLKNLERNEQSALKRDKGGKAARELILEQNKLILEGLNRIEETMASGFGGGGTGGGGEGPNKPESQKSTAEKDLEDAAKNTKEITEKEKKKLPKLSPQGDLFAGTDDAPPEPKERIRREKKKKEISDADRKLADKTTVGQGDGAAGTGRKLDTEDKRRGKGMDDEDFARQWERDQAALKREGGVKDVGGLSKDVKTTGKSLNKRKISGQELSKNPDMFDTTGNLVFNEKEELRIGQTNYKRAGDYSSGTARFQDVDTGKFAVTDPVKALAEDVRISQGVVGTTRNRFQHDASKGAGTLAKNIGADAANIQKQLDANDEAKTDLNDVIKSLDKLQSSQLGDKDKAKTRAELETKAEKLRISGGEELYKNLGMDDVRKQATGMEGGKLGKVGSALKSFGGINQGVSLKAASGEDRFSMGSASGGIFNKTLNKATSAMNISKSGFKSGVKDFFTADRWFGKAGTGGMSNKLMFQGKRQFQEEAQRDAEVESQGEALGRMYSSETGLGVADDTKAGKDVLRDADGNVIFDAAAKKEEWKDQYVPEKQRTMDDAEIRASQGTDAQQIQAADDAKEDAEKDTKESKDAAKETRKSTKEKTDKRTGQSTEPLAQKQLETLEEMLEVLEKIESNGGMGGGSGDGEGEDDGGRRRRRNRGRDKDKDKKGKKGKRTRSRSRRGGSRRGSRTRGGRGIMKNLTNRIPGRMGDRIRNIRMPRGGVGSRLANLMPRGGGGGMMSNMASRGGGMMSNIASRGGGMMSNMASRGSGMLARGGGMLARGAGAVGSGLGSVASGAGGLLKGVGSIASKAFLPLTAAAGVIGGVRQAFKTDEFGEEGENPTMGMRGASAVGGLVSGLTFGMVGDEGADKISKAVYGKTDMETMEAVKEKDPELYAKMQTRLKAGDDLSDVIKDEGENIKEAGVDNRGLFTKALDASPFGMLKRGLTDLTTTTDRERGLDEAQEGGLYRKRGLMGQSSIDKSKLEGATAEQLKGIIDDDDLSSEDMMAVKEALVAKREGKDAASLASVTTPTAAAVGNMTGISGDAAALETESIGAKTGAMIAAANKMGPGAAAGAQSGKEDSGKIIGMFSTPGVRNNDHVVHRMMDQRFS